MAMKAPLTVKKVRAMVEEARQLQQRLEDEASREAISAATSRPQWLEDASPPKPRFGGGGPGWSNLVPLPPPLAQHLTALRAWCKQCLPGR